MTQTTAERDAKANTDRVLWRESSLSEHHADKLFVTEGGGIGMEVGGLAIVKPMRDWHKLAADASPGSGEPVYVGGSISSHLEHLASPSPSVTLTEDEVFTLQAAVENLRGGGTDPDAKFRIAYKLEQIAKRAAIIRG